MTHTALEPSEYAALERLLRLALNDTASARCAADFLLAWHNAEEYGGFDPSRLWEMKAQQVADLLALMAYVARAGHGPDRLGLEEEMRRIVAVWRSPPDTADGAA